MVPRPSLLKEQLIIALGLEPGDNESLDALKSDATLHTAAKLFIDRYLKPEETERRLKSLNARAPAISPDDIVEAVLQHRMKYTVTVPGRGAEPWVSNDFWSWITLYVVENTQLPLFLSERGFMEKKLKTALELIKFLLSTWHQKALASKKLFDTDWERISEGIAIFCARRGGGDNVSERDGKDDNMHSLRPRTGKKDYRVKSPSSLSSSDDSFSTTHDDELLYLRPHLPKDEARSIPDIVARVGLSSGTGLRRPSVDLPPFKRHRSDHTATNRPYELETVSHDFLAYPDLEPPYNEREVSSYAVGNSNPRLGASSSRAIANRIDDRPTSTAIAVLRGKVDLYRTEIRVNDIAIREELEKVGSYRSIIHDSEIKIRDLTELNERFSGQVEATEAELKALVGVDG